MATTCRACDSLDVLDQLVRTGLWSKRDSLLNFNRVVLDVDSIVLSLYRLCVANHLKRQSSINNKHTKPDLYSATLVNYTEYSHLVKQLLDSLQDHKIQPVLVYGGKPMEAPLFGLLAAEFTKNTQSVVGSISIINDYDKVGFINGGPCTGADLKYGRQMGRPNLALIIFKSIINVRRRAGAEIRVIQAFYSPYPVMARMARDLKCPVITNNGDFIIMDVRAGFVLFEEFWVNYVDKHNLEARGSKGPSSASSQGRTKSQTRGTVDGSINFHYNSLFLHQHPGMNAPLAMNLYPLTTVDFVTKFGDSLKRLKVFDTAYKEKDFLPPTNLNGSGKSMYRKHHMAANRLEMVLTFLSGKTVDIMGNLIRSEATRTNTSFDDDFRNLFNWHAVAFEFKHRLRFALKYLHDPLQLNYIEWCLINRECTSDYLLDLLCCSIGRLACVSYNKGLQFEDVKTKHSAYWLKNRGKSMLMSLFTANKSHKGEHSLSNKQQDTVTRYSTASLTMVDRQHGKLVESNLDTIHENNQLDAIRDKLQLAALSRQKVAKRDCAKFINLAFQATDITSMQPKLEALVSKHLAKDEHSIRNELAIVRSLFIYSYQSASGVDNYFKSSYAQLVHQFEIAIVNHYLYMNEKLSKQKQTSLTSLVNLITKHDFENVAANNFDKAVTSGSGTGSETKKTVSSDSKSPKSPKGKHQKQNSSSNLLGSDTSKQVRHLIELLGASMEAYCELNAFFAYPLPRLNISLHYNPILLYNLTHQTDNKALMKF